MAPAAMLAIVDITAGEILMILVIGLIVLGPERLPQVARMLGAGMAKGRRMLASLQAEMRDVLDDPAMQPLKEVGEFVAQPRKKLTEMALQAEAEANEAAVAAEPSERARAEARRHEDSDTATSPGASSPVRDETESPSAS